ncbi:MAG: RNA-binding protein [Epsilonproteobacteria bacterium]|nr:RNA-binding protein [Campylobacterota bacterium]
MKKLYVGNLPRTVTEDALKPLFEQHGDVESVKVIMDKFTGQAKGFAFIEMGDADQAQAAIDGLNDYELEGRRMRVSQARPQEPRRDRFGSRGGQGGPSRGGFGGNGGGGRGGFGGGDRWGR